MSKIYVDIYSDNTGLFSESECNVDNSCCMAFEEDVVREFFDTFVKPSYDWDISFEQWLAHEYTCDDTDGLYYYAVSKGDHPYFDVGNLCNVFYREDTYSYKHVVFTGDLTECREFGRENGWTWQYDDDEYELEVSL